VSKEEELAGLDRSEHGNDAYPEFVFQHEVIDLRGSVVALQESANTAAEAAVPAERVAQPA
jgi:hypothetical protein